MDAKSAYENFAGKTHEEAIALFRENALNYAEDFMWMPTACFPFYANAFIAYLLSPAAQGDAEGARGFLMVIEARLEDRGVARLDKSFIERIAETVKHLSGNQGWYDPGEFCRPWLKRSERLISKLNPLLDR